MSRVQDWIVLAAGVLAVLVVAFVVAMLRASRQIPPAPVEEDPLYLAAVEAERRDVEAIEAELEQGRHELVAVLDADDADDRSAQLAGLLNGGSW